MKEKIDMIRMLTAFAVAAALTALVLPGSALAGDAAAGKIVYEANCSSCHGTSGKGDGPVGKALNPPPRDFTIGDFKFDTDGNGKAGEDADLKAVIQKGAMAFGGSPLMAPWPALDETQVDDIIAHIRSLKQ
jgi:mono/diheme cytochrome c family protein